MTWRANRQALIFTASALMMLMLSACAPQAEDKMGQDWSERGYYTPAPSKINHLGPTAGIF